MVTRTHDQHSATSALSHLSRGDASHFFTSEKTRQTALPAEAEMSEFIVGPRKHTGSTEEEIITAFA